MGWLGKIWPRKVRDFPAMFRVTLVDGKPATMIHATAIAPKSGTTIRRDMRATHGLCIFPWPVGIPVLQIRLESEDGFADVEVRADRSQPEWVMDIQLEPMATSSI